MKIEANSPEELLEVQQFLYEKKPDLLVEEQYDMSPGFHKEPVTVAIIIALGGSAITKTVQLLIKQYFAYKTAKLHEETKRQKLKKDIDADLIKISLEKGKGWSVTSTKEFMEMKLQ